MPSNIVFARDVPSASMCHLKTQLSCQSNTLLEREGGGGGTLERNEGVCTRAQLPTLATNDRREITQGLIAQGNLEVDLHISANV